MGDERPVGLLPQQPPLAARDDEQRPVGQPVEAERQRAEAAGHHLAAPIEADGEDLAGAPVREPEPAVVPARRLAQHEAGQQQLGLRHSPGSPAARSSSATSSFFIWSMAAITRCAFSLSGSASSWGSAVGTTCQETPKRSLSQPQGPSSPPSVSLLQ